MKAHGWMLTLALLTAPLGCREKMAFWRHRDAGTTTLPLGEWTERTDLELDQEIEAALGRARQSRKKVLLEFVAPWCTDCQQMTRIEMLPPASDVLASQYERVRINVGRFDRHMTLMRTYGIDRIAAYVVLNAATGMREAQTTMEPVSNHRDLTPEMWAEWLRRPHDASQLR